MHRLTALLVLATVACGGGGPPARGPAAAASPGVAPVPAEDVPVVAAPPAAPAASPTPAAALAPAAPPTPIADAYRETAARLREAGLAERGAYRRLAYLTDRIGPRMAGSKALDQAIDWAERSLRADGHENVRREKVMVVSWVRGQESAAIVAPVARPLRILGLGLSPGTPKKGVTAEVVMVRSFDELDALGAAGVKGKIVFYNHEMPKFDPEKGPGYGEASRYRTRGPARAAALGAAAVLVRSATAVSLGTPHTGVTIFDAKGPKVPAAAVTLEDAELLERLLADGPVTVKLVMGARQGPNVPSANVIAELRGREKPGEIVLIGAHLDSWDVGQGAHDDGAGVVMMMEALHLLRAAGLTPRRTIRVVLFTNEEAGIDGGRSYAETHAAELPDHIAAIEADSGGYRPMGYMIAGKPDAPHPALPQLADIVTLLEPLGAARARMGFGGSDIEPMGKAGVPLLGHWVDVSTYFDIHHTEADTLDKVDPQHLQMNAVAVAIVAYVLADMPERLAR